MSVYLACHSTLSRLGSILTSKSGNRAQKYFTSMSVNTYLRYNNRVAGREVDQDIASKRDRGRGLGIRYGSSLIVESNTSPPIWSTKRTRCTGHISTRPSDTTTRQDVCISKLQAGAASPIQQKVSVRKSGPCRKCYRMKDAAVTLRRILDSWCVNDTSMILRTIGIIAAARRSMTLAELVSANKTQIRPPYSRQNRPSANQESRDCGDGNDIDLMALCGGLLRVDSSGNVKFCHQDMQHLVSSLGFQQQFGLRDGDEMLAGICIQHLQCGKQTSDQLASTGPAPCRVSGRKSCELQNYAIYFWKKHYLAIGGGSQWIHSLLHQAVVSSLPKTEFAEMQCRSSCNYVLATGLEMAAAHDLLVVGRTYVEMGAEIHPCSHSMRTPLHTAAANSSTNMVKFLLECGANPNAIANSVLDSPCLCATSDVAILSPLVKCGPGYDEYHCWRCSRSASGQTPLHLAAAAGAEETMRLLVVGGAHIEIRTKCGGETALHLAAMSGNIGAVQYLIACGADTRSQNFAGETALQVAMKEHHYSIAKMLLPATRPATPQASFNDIPYVEAESGDGHATNPVWRMQHLSLVDVPHESPVQRLKDAVLMTSMENVSGVNRQIYPAQEELPVHDESWVLV
jgi:ankyrin repeat protein